MCQIDNKPIRAEKIEGYRAYLVPTGYSTPRSYYNMCKITTLNKRVRCSKNERPFHAFRSKSSLKRWLRRNVDTTLSDMRIFRVQFSGEMKRGTWDGDWSIKTITGEYCTVLENVTTEFIPTRNRK